ncbi:ATP-binding protein [Halomonas sp. CH40]
MMIACPSEHAVRHKNYLPIYVALLVSIFVLLLYARSGHAQGKEYDYVDLSYFDEKSDLFLLMQAASLPEESAEDLQKVLHTADWRPATQVTDILLGPRKSTTRWFKLPVKNSQNEHLIRWLEISPWYLQNVTVWQLDPETLTINEKTETGLNVPLSNRSFESYRTTIPLELKGGEKTLLLLRVEGTNRSIFTMHSWKPERFIAQETSGHYYHIVLFSSVLTLFLIMIIQLDLRSFVLGLWMVVTLFLDAEKAGFFSFYVLLKTYDFLSHIAPQFSDYLDVGLPYASVHFEHKGYVAWMLNDVIFITVSVLLLGVWKKDKVMTTLEWLWGSVLFLSFLPHVVESYYFQYTGIAFSLMCSVIWLVIFFKALSVKRTWQKHLLSLLFFWWVIFVFTTLDYLINSTYAAPTPPWVLLTKFVVVLAIMLIYTFQRRDRAQALAAKLRYQEKEQREKLERAVNERTYELHQAMNEAHRANEAKTRFLGRVTHDLKSPLTSILGYAQLLSAESGKAGEMSQVIYKSASHMHRLIDRLIDYARGVTDDKERATDVYLYSFLAGIDHESRILAKLNDNTFTMEVSNSVPPVIVCDETFLHEVLINLIENALKYTQRGNVHLSVSGQPEEKQQSARLSLVLVDNGCGIDSHMQKIMFEPFSREQGDKSGVGLGLSIAKELAERMHGSLNIVSEKDQGTRAELSLPVVIGNEEDTSVGVISSPAHILPEVDASGLIAWMIEDAEPIRDMMALELETLGFEVRTFSSASEVAAVLEAGVKQPDVVITDYWLGNELGGEVLRQIKAYAEATPVILVSATWNLLKEGLKSPELEDDALHFSAYVTKPVNLINLRREIARVCELNIQEPGQQSEVAPITAVNQKAEISAEEREKLTLWIELGAVTDIVEWCQSFAAEGNGQPSGIEEIHYLALRGDFKGIKKLI